MLQFVLFSYLLSSLFHLSLGATTVLEWSLQEDLRPYEQISVFAGDSIRFEYPGDTINVLRTSGSCDSTDSELIGEAGEGTATYTFSADQIDTVVTFATDYLNYCSFGMIIDVLVLEPPPSAAPSETPSAAPSGIPTLDPIPGIGSPTMTPVTQTIVITGAPLPGGPTLTPVGASDVQASEIPSDAPSLVPSVGPTQVDRADDPTLVLDTISVGDVTVLDWSLPQDLQPYEQVTMFAGDTLKFQYPGTTINVLRNPSGTCDGTGSELIGAAGEGSATYTFEDNQIDTVVTFATDYWNFCSLGMIINVLVLEPPPSSAPSLAPSPSPSLGPSPQPSMIVSEGPAFFVTDLPSGHTVSGTEEAVIDWSLPEDTQPYDKISVYARGTIRFEYPGFNINVLRNPSGTCDGTGSELVGAAGEGNATYTFNEDQIDTVVTFATNYWNYCNFGMIINVLVLEPPPSAAPSTTPSGIPTLAPVVSTDMPSIAPSPSTPFDQPTMALTGAPFLDPTETVEPTIAKKTRPPTDPPVAVEARSAATSLLTSLSVILASTSVLVI